MLRHTPRHVRSRLAVSVTAVASLVVAAAVPAGATHLAGPEVSIAPAFGPQDVTVVVEDRATATAVTLRSLDPGDVVIDTVTTDVTDTWDFHAEATVPLELGGADPSALDVTGAAILEAVYDADGQTYTATEPWYPVDGSKVLYDRGEATVTGAAGAVFAGQTVAIDDGGTTLGSATAASDGSFQVTVTATPEWVAASTTDAPDSTLIVAGEPTAAVDGALITAFTSADTDRASIAGDAGAAGAFVPVRVYADAGLTEQVGSVSADHDGSIPETSLSRAADTLWLVAQDETFNGRSLPSEPVEVSAQAVQVPDGLVVDGAYEAAYLDWTAVPEADSYNVYRSDDGSTFDRIASDVSFSEWNEYGLTNGQTYWFHVTAQYGAIETAPSATVSATAVAEQPADWPMCTGPADTRCVETLTVDGQTPPDGLTAHVWEEGALQWQFRHLDDYELVTDGSTLTADSVIQVTIDVGRDSIGVVTSTGDVSDLRVTTDGAGHTQVEILASPARTSWADFGCDTSACGDDTLAADRDYAGMLIGSMAVRDAVEIDALGGSWIATDAQAFSAPYFDPAVDGMVFEVAAPHLRADGEVNTGFFRSFITDTALRDLYGISDPSTVTYDSFETTRRDGGSETTVHPSVQRVDGGVIVELASYGYSSPEFTIARAADSPGDGDVVDGPGDDGDGGGDAGDGGAVGGGDSGTTTEPEDGVTTGTPAAGGTVDSDTDGDGPTATDPVEVAVTTPSGGPVRVEKQPAAGDVPGFSLVGVQLDITAPAETADQPLRLALSVDASAVADRDVVGVFRNGRLVPACTDPDSGQAAPDPCVAGRSWDDGHLRLTVLTSAASTWAIGRFDPSSLAVACPSTTTPSARFSDVSGTHAAAVDCVASWEVAHGVSPSAFAPHQAVTRGQLAALLVRLLETAGVELAGGPSDFTDIPGHVHADAIERLAAAGLTRGMTETRYGPDLPVSRAQMASFLTAAHAAVSGEPLPPGTDRFEDVPSGAAHADAVAALVEAGIANGSTSTIYRPDGAVTRAQAASFLARLLNRLAAEGLVTNE